MKHKTRTKALSWLLSLAMALSLLPGLSLTARAAATELPAAVDGVITLTGDVELASTWEVSDTVTLDLNDYGIRLTGFGSVIKVPSGASLTITDSSATKTTRYISLTSGRGTAVSTAQPDSGSYVTVSGGYITGGTGTARSNSRYGGGVYSEGTFNMAGGTICGNTASRGGGVYNAGTFTITGGTIADNKVDNQGGGVYNNGPFVMDGGAISGNTASYGGGVHNYYEKSTFTMNDGLISSNHSTYNGGGVNNGATFTMNGGIISDNQASYGGGVYSGNSTSTSTYGYGSFVMTGGTISNNTASSVGAVFKKENSSTNITIGADNKAVIATMSTDGSGDKLTYSTSNIENYGYIAVVPTYTYQAATVDATTHEVTFSEQTVNDYTVVAKSVKDWTNGKWYVVSSDVTISDRITVTGTVNLILCDGATLTASKGITVAEGNTLNIYGQSGGTGELIASCDYVYAAIGGDSTYNEDPFYYLSNKAGTIVINGGKVTATNTESGAGIGNYSSAESAGTLIVNGGTVTATGGNYGAGIGGSEDSAGMAVTINGGTVTATGGNYGSGIGGGKNGNGGSFTIYGGAVTATGGQYAGAGIGGGSYASGITGSTVAIHGGQVTASSRQDSFAAGIDCRKTSLTVSGGTVTATGADAAGIDVGKDGTINVTGGTVVTAASGTDGVGKGMTGPINLGSGMYLYGGDEPDPENELTNYVAKVDDDYARSKYMTVNNVTPHTHDFTYAANGTTITATCSEEGCTLPASSEGGSDHIATLTITAPANLVVGGGAKGATLEGEIPGVTPTITYTPGGAAPTTPGTYTASVTLGGATASVQYTLKAASYTITIPARLPVSKAGWNATAGITAKGEIAEDKMLRIRAESDNDWKLKQDGKTDTITYYLATAANGAKTTAWSFSVADLAGVGTNKPMGAVVEEYINKPAGEYTDTVTFTAEVVDTTSVTLADALVNGATFSVTFKEDEDVYVASFANVNGELVNPALTRNGETVALKSNDDNSDGYSLSSWTYNSGFVVHLSSIDSSNVLNAFQTYLSFDTEKNVRHDKNVTSIVVNGIEIIDSVPYEKQSGGG